MHSVSHFILEASGGNTVAYICSAVVHMTTQKALAHEISSHIGIRFEYTTEEEASNSQSTYCW